MVIFTAGHDRSFRPIIYLNVNKIKSSEIDDFKHCVSYFALAIKKRLLKDYFIENWILMIDLEGRSVLNLPIKALKGLIETTAVTFAGVLHRLNFLNPSLMFYGAWTVISNLLHPSTREKIHVIGKGKTKELLKDISADQLLDKYGGTLKPPTRALPIIPTFFPNEMPDVLSTEQTYIPPLPKNIPKPVEQLIKSERVVPKKMVRNDIFSDVQRDSDVILSGKIGWLLHSRTQNDVENVHFFPGELPVDTVGSLLRRTHGIRQYLTFKPV